MQPIINSTGIHIQTFEEIFKELVDNFKLIYGDDIIVDQNSPDGQRIGIFAKAILDSQTAILKLYNDQDIDLAEGIALDRLIKLLTLNRRPATKSQWELIVKCSDATTLDTNYTIEDSLKQQWKPNKNYSLKKGDNNVVFEAVEYGNIQGVINSVITPLTIVLEVQSITAVKNAIAGVEEESDFALRERDKKSTGINATSTIGALEASLANLPNVKNVRVHENFTSATDSLGVDAHSFWIVVDGGDSKDIARVIAQKKTGGTGMKGDIEGVYVESLKRPDNSVYTITHRVKYDKPSYKELFLKFDYKKINPVLDIDIDLVKTNLMSYIFRIGEDIIASRFYQLGYLNQTNLILENIQISKAKDSGFVTDKIAVVFNELYSLPKANIVGNLIS